jgi:hypothetical protein
LATTISIQIRPDQGGSEMLSRSGKLSHLMAAIGFSQSIGGKYDLAGRR